MVDVLQAKGLEVCDEVKDPTKEEKLVQRMISDLMPYFASEITFDSSNVREKLGDDFLNWKLDINFLKKMITMYYKKEFPELL